jgi:hypothetical protein
MEASDQLARMAPRRLSDPAAVMRDEVHHQQVWLGMMDKGRADPTAAPARPACKPELEARLCVARALPRLDREAAPIGEFEREACESEANWQRTRMLDHGRAERLFKSRLERAADHRLVINPVGQCHKPATKSLWRIHRVEKGGEDDVLHEPG